MRLMLGFFRLFNLFNLIIFLMLFIFSSLGSLFPWSIINVKFLSWWFLRRREFCRMAGKRYLNQDWCFLFFRLEFLFLMLRFLFLRLRLLFNFFNWNIFLWLNLRLNSFLLSFSFYAYYFTSWSFLSGTLSCWSWFDKEQFDSYLLQKVLESLISDFFFKLLSYRPKSNVSLSLFIPW